MGIGPIIGTLLIVIVLIAGAIYAWGQHLNLLQEENQARIEQRDFLNSASATSTTSASGLGTSTNISDIEHDLNNLK